MAYSRSPFSTSCDGRPPRKFVRKPAKASKDAVRHGNQPAPLQQQRQQRLPQSPQPAQRFSLTQQDYQHKQPSFVSSMVTYMALGAAMTLGIVFVRVLTGMEAEDGNTDSGLQDFHSKWARVSELDGPLGQTAKQRAEEQ